ncbi:MAG: hypothetical protein F6K26_11765 [Moorea sp. SIO2I5]|nr:hypothetical protein [Moorena sp. SIO2I5]
MLKWRLLAESPQTKVNGILTLSSTPKARFYYNIPGEQYRPKSPINGYQERSNLCICSDEGQY